MAEHDLSQLGRALMHFFSPDQLPKNDKGQPVPTTLGEFVGQPNRFPPQSAHAAAEKLAASGFLLSTGQRPGPPMIESTYIAAAREGTDPELFDFIVGGFPEIRRRRSYAVLHLDVNRPDGAKDSGTGFLISETMMITARHCVEGMDFSICDPRSPSERLPRAGDPFFNDADFAVVMLLAGHGLPWFRMSRPNYLDDVMAMGYPSLEGLNPTLVTSTGEIAGDSTSYLDGNHYWLTSCALTGGSSGGPVVNDRGEVVGVVSAVPAGDRSVRSAPFGVMVSPVDGFESLASREPG